MDGMTNNTNSNIDNKPLLIGLEHLPTPIKQFMLNTLENRLTLPRVYHVTEILYCLKKAYYRRTYPKTSEIDTRGIWNIYRGNTFDALWSPLFKINQRTYLIENKGFDKKPIYITGKLDFIWIDETNQEKILYDLKMPSTTYYRKEEGAGKFYTAQVQTYLSMAHLLNELLDVHRCRVMMLADNLVIAEIPENDPILDLVWDRTFKLDKAIMQKKPELLYGPEEKWECGEPYCDADITFKDIYCKKEEQKPPPSSSLLPL